MTGHSGHHGKMEPVMKNVKWDRQLSVLRLSAVPTGKINNSIAASTTIHTKEKMRRFKVYNTGVRLSRKKERQKKRNGKNIHGIRHINQDYRQNYLETVY